MKIPDDFDPRSLPGLLSRLSFAYSVLDYSRGDPQLIREICQPVGDTHSTLHRHIGTWRDLVAHVTESRAKLLAHWRENEAVMDDLLLANKKPVELVFHGWAEMFAGHFELRVQARQLISAGNEKEGEFVTLFSVTQVS